MGDPLEQLKKFGKMRNLNSLTGPKKGAKSYNVEKVERGTLLLWNGLLDALDALKMKY